MSENSDEWFFNKVGSVVDVENEENSSFIFTLSLVQICNEMFCMNIDKCKIDFPIGVSVFFNQRFEYFLMSEEMLNSEILKNL